MRAFLFPLLLLSSFAIAQTKTDPVIKYTNFEGKACKEDKAAFVRLNWQEGNIWKSEERFYPSNILHIEGSFADKHLKMADGVFTTYFENGKKASEQGFKNGKKEGLFTKWAEDGVIARQYTYRADVLVDTTFIYNSDGTIGKKQLVDKDGTGKIFCYYRSGKLLSQIQLKTGKKDGDSFYYTENGELVETIAYADGSMIRTTCKEVGQPCKNLDLPEFQNGVEGWRRYLEKNLVYPEFAQENGIQGIVEMRFDVDEQGNISNITVVGSPHRSLSEEAVRIFKAGPQWIPSNINGQPMKATVYQTITFKLG